MQVKGTNCEDHSLGSSCESHNIIHADHTSYEVVECQVRADRNHIAGLMPSRLPNSTEES